jgi:hypothetical protein
MIRRGRRLNVSAAPEIKSATTASIGMPPPAIRIPSFT